MVKKHKILSNSSYRSINDLKRQMLKRAFDRAKKKGIPFNINIDDIILPLNNKCPIMKKPLLSNTRYSASLDKKIPELGYVKGNVYVISSLANGLKGDASKEEIKMFCKNINKYMR